MGLVSIALPMTPEVISLIRPPDNELVIKSNVKEAPAFFLSEVIYFAILPIIPKAGFKALATVRSIEPDKLN